eukprot:COSAG01_NODE_2609_length_7389_cov_19.579467_4_plen_127_part_00
MPGVDLPTLCRARRRVLVPYWRSDKAGHWHGPHHPIDRKSAVVSTKGGRVVRQGEIEAKLEGIAGVQHALAHASPEWHGVAVVLSVDPAWLMEIGVESNAMELGDVIEDPAVHLSPAEGAIDGEWV